MEKVENVENLETPQTKEVLWQKEYLALDKIADSCGEKIENGIKNTLVALRLLGFNTSSSCEGHTGEIRGKDNKYEVTRSPYVQIEALDQPRFRFKNEEHYRQRLATEYNLPIKDINLALGGYGNDPHVELLEKIINSFEEIVELENYPETDDYKKWEEDNLLLGKQLMKYLEEFYEKREAQSDIKLELRHGRLSSGVEWNENETEKQSYILQHAEELKKEMRDFTEFLKKKYFDQK